MIQTWESVRFLCIFFVMEFPSGRIGRLIAKDLLVDGSILHQSSDGLSRRDSRTSSGTKLLHQVVRRQVAVVSPAQHLSSHPRRPKPTFWVMIFWAAWWCTYSSKFVLQEQTFRCAEGRKARRRPKFSCMVLTDQSVCPCGTTKKAYGDVSRPAAGSLVCHVTAFGDDSRT
jgi:hypothetical protein